MSKKYASVDFYENKLEKVMTRLGVEKYEYDFSRKSSFIEFFYKGQMFRFEHSVDKSKDTGNPLQYGSDCFAQLVLTLEDLARMVERGIYDLSVWVSGMKMLETHQEIPECLQRLNFIALPTSKNEIKKRYRELASVYHPDSQTGNAELFNVLHNAYEEALKLFDENKN